MEMALINLFNQNSTQCVYRNLVITGVPEEPADLDGATTEKEKFEKVCAKMSISDANPVEISRMGAPASDRIRPILVKMSSKAQREKVLKNSKALKNAGAAFQKVYVRKDVHPATRREWKRLKDAEKNEKEKPENAASTITLDYKSRVLMRDNVIIDRWKPTYFL